jgi:protein-S-isoprenylcysteine O-methyltransferase Ste14
MTRGIDPPDPPRRTGEGQGRPALRRSRPLFGGAIVLYFLIALEVLIMISPFAAFFYAAFNPVLLFLARSTATRWLASFFLPHMVLPPGSFLKGLRVAGSVLFVGGLAVFLICAGQVYSHKLLRRGPALSGLYRIIRHPQYVALAWTGLGLSILWPRFLTVVLWALMVGVYSLLARDEERRMLNQFGDQYRAYMERTGRFVPRAVERAFDKLLPRSAAARGVTNAALVMGLSVGGAFALRAYTISRLPLWSQGRVTAMTILPGDAMMLEHRMSSVLELPQVQSRLDEVSGPVLVYLIPRQYIMQGMIADTGPQWRLYMHHQTLAMITDWIFHPFRHLQGGHMMMHHEMAGTSSPEPSNGVVRRLIFLRIGSEAARGTPGSLFGVNAERVPLFYVDIDIHNLVVLDVRDLGSGTGWGRVPTPMF